MTPTMHLRFVEQDMAEPHPTQADISVIKRARVLQQFWETPKGTEVLEDEFIKIYGIWRNIPLVVNK